MSSAFRNAFDKFDLTIKWKRGKCEAMVRYRGRSASRHLDARRTEDGLLIIVDHTTALHVVTEYKHLGGVTTDSGCIMPEINQRVSLMRSLVVSRRLYNVQILTMTVAGLRRLNLPYMRSWRCIIGESRFSASCNLSDLEVQRSLGMPSVVLLVLQKQCVLQPSARQRPEMPLGVIAIQMPRTAFAVHMPSARELLMITEYCHAPAGCALPCLD